MAGSLQAWLVDGNRIATKIMCASGTHDPEGVKWKSNPCKACPNCQHVIDNSDVTYEWPGLPKGVKFDPSDPEIIWHLLAKIGMDDLNPHPFIDEFIPTVFAQNGICYSHPQYLPGVKRDGSVSHFFHRAIKAYNTGTRKRRKIDGDDCGDVRWHKTGRTKPVSLYGVQKGCKKIMVLYTSLVRGGKSEKTNWVMHQYHLGMAEDEKEGDFVISKIFYQQQQVKLGDKAERDLTESSNSLTVKVDPVTPISLTPDPPRTERRPTNVGPDELAEPEYLEIIDIDEEIFLPHEDPENHDKEMLHQHEEESACNEANDNYDHIDVDSKWLENDSLDLLNSQQLVEGLSICDDLLQSQSPNRENQDGDNKESSQKPRLSDYAKLGAEDLKKDLEECQKLGIDHSNIELDNTPSEFRLSQLDFGSEESFVAWGGPVGAMHNG